MGKLISEYLIALKLGFTTIRVHKVIHATSRYDPSYSRTIEQVIKLANKGWLLESISSRTDEIDGTGIRIDLFRECTTFSAIVNGWRPRI